MANLAPIIMHEMPTAMMHCNQLGPLLLRTLRMEIPGFKVPARKELRGIAAEDRHVQIAEAVAHTLAYMFPDLMPVQEEYGGSPTVSQKPIGPLHHDLYKESDPTEEATTFDINTTLSGGGSVLLASFGSHPNIAMGSQERAHQQILDGIVDPHIVNPHVYQTSVGYADTVVWADGGCATAWHRFDTEPKLGERLGMLTIMRAASNLEETGDYPYPDFPVDRNL
jgi:hypothetical protein